jgi:hypothetical protein
VVRDVQPTFDDMKIEELVDIEKFVGSMPRPNKHMFQTWSSTAIEISPEKSQGKKYRHDMPAFCTIRGVQPR